MNSNQRNLATQYLSQIGLAGLGAGQQYAGQIAGLGMQGIGVLSNLSQLPFPSPGMLNSGGYAQNGGASGGGISGMGGGGMSFVPFPSGPNYAYNRDTAGAGGLYHGPIGQLGTGTVSPAYTYPQAESESGGSSTAWTNPFPDQPLLQEG